jgi:arylsulfatase A-like enzyme
VSTAEQRRVPPRAAAAIAFAVGCVAVGACLATAACSGAPAGDAGGAATQTAPGDRPADQPNAAAAPTPASAPAGRRRRAARTAGDGVNVVIFLIDTLRADRLGVYGYGRPTSPAIDDLAAHGVVFEQAYAASPWTLPSVASIFTSTPICEHNTLSRYDRLSPDCDTLAERLFESSYVTMLLYANRFLAPEFGLKDGFLLYRASPRTDGRRLAGGLDTARAGRYFLYIHNIEPHDPYHFAPPSTPGFRDIGEIVRAKMRLHAKAYKSAAQQDYRARRPLGTTDGTAEQDQHFAELMKRRDDWSELYDATVRYSDSLLGSVVETLKERGEWEDTLFILLSDHGEEFGEHGGWGHDQSVYEELLRVPLIIRFPRDEFAGTRIREPVTHLDILPTVLDYLKLLNRAGGARGTSLMPAIRGQARRDPVEPLVVGMRINTTRYYKPWNTTRGDVNIALRLGAWKGIWNASIDTFELYDLAGDPAETRNVATAQAVIVERLRNAARTFYEQCQTQRRDATPAEPLSEETLRNLRSLGYVE